MDDWCGPRNGQPQGQHPDPAQSRLLLHRYARREPVQRLHRALDPPQRKEQAGEGGGVPGLPQRPAHLLQCRRHVLALHLPREIPCKGLPLLQPGPEPRQWQERAATADQHCTPLIASHICGHSCPDR